GWVNGAFTRLNVSRSSLKPTTCFTRSAICFFSSSVSGLDCGSPSAPATMRLLTTTASDRRLIVPTCWIVWLMFLLSSHLVVAFSCCFTGAAPGGFCATGSAVGVAPAGPVIGAAAGYGGWFVAAPGTPPAVALGPVCTVSELFELRTAAFSGWP